ncbi:MAG: hypothetical protein MZW92_16555 [Comamonadaceae bacterium]|nr:hypothetical protein [Comamonadaceae bacterium]
MPASVIAAGVVDRILDPAGLAEEVAQLVQLGHGGRPAPRTGHGAAGARRRAAAGGADHRAPDPHRLPALQDRHAAAAAGAAAGAGRRAVPHALLPAAGARPGRGRGAARRPADPGDRVLPRPRGLRVAEGAGAAAAGAGPARPHARPGAACGSAPPPPARRPTRWRCCWSRCSRKRAVEASSFATDVEPGFLARASAGRYPAKVLDSIPKSMHRWLAPSGDSVQIDATLRHRIVFGAARPADRPALHAAGPRSAAATR